MEGSEIVAIQCERVGRYPVIGGTINGCNYDAYFSIGWYTDALTAGLGGILDLDDGACTCNTSTTNNDVGCLCFTNCTDCCGCYCDIPEYNSTNLSSADCTDSCWSYCYTALCDSCDQHLTSGLSSSKSTIGYEGPIVLLGWLADVYCWINGATDGRCCGWGYYEAAKDSGWGYRTGYCGACCWGCRYTAKDSNGANR